MVAADVFLFLGADCDAKREKLIALQKKFFPPELKEFNYTVLFGDQKALAAKELKEMLLAIPTEGANKRLLLVRQAHKLNKVNLKCIEDSLRDGFSKIAVILDVPDVEDTESLVSGLSKLGAQVIRFKHVKLVNIFDLGRAIVDNDPERALKILSEVIAYRERPEKIVGTIFWQWERTFTQKHLSLDIYKKGLKIILEADRKLKSYSSVYARQQLILEALVVKLSYLKAGRD